MKRLAIILTVLTAFSVTGQESTIQKKNADNREITTAQKVLIVPFEPRLYMGEVDRQINAETRLSAREIRFRFRDGLNEQIYRAFRSAKFSALDLMGDTIRYKKEIENIYQYLSYQYMKVPDQKNYKPPVKEKAEKRIEKGQLNVETNSDPRFMNAYLTNSRLIPGLASKYKSHYFVFVNQLDIKASGSRDPLFLGQDTEMRRIVVHYTIFDKQGKEINSGIVEENFAPTLNDPKRIIDKHFSRIGETLVQRVNAQLALNKKN